MVNPTPENILGELIAIPSVNPMGEEFTPDICGESRLTDYLQGFLQRLGLPTKRIPAEPGRDNLVALLAAPQASRPTLLLEAHQDTVPIKGMTIDPFAAEISNGRLHGRGACDVKGAMAAILAMLVRLVRQPPEERANVLIAFTVNEEFGFTGARALAAELRDPDEDGVLRRPDFAIVSEPTELDVVVAHKGIARFLCHASGKAAHGSEPRRGENAIYRMARLLEVIEKYEEEVLASSPCHPLCGRATLNVGTIQGGVSVNTVPDRCTINIDRRLHPEEDAENSRAQFERHVRQAIDWQASLEVGPTYMAAGPLPDSDNGPLAERLATLVKKSTGKCRQIGVPYATDAPFFAEVGIPTVVFGPGSINQAHTCDEWIDLAQVDRAADLLRQFVISLGHDKKN